MSDPLTELGVATGAAAASGLRLYGTVAALGLLHRFGVLDLPGSLQVLASPAIIALAGALYVAEFVADKVPAFDSMWDAVHTFIRIPAGAVLAFGLLGGVHEPWRTAAALLGGTVALSAHGLKASARLAANASPEPFTNWGLSFSEGCLGGDAALARRGASVRRARRRARARGARGARRHADHGSDTTAAARAGARLTRSHRADLTPAAAAA
jgi:hypothetical protein